MKIANRYEIIKEIGKGGMANVYLALDTYLNREVAIKVLKGDMSNDPVSLERFKREANASTKLSHPNAVDVYDVGDDHNMHYIVMEYVKGHTLKELIKRRGALPPKEAVWIMKQLASALLEAHKNGIIHRDIKSQNVLIKDDGTVKLADFGIAVIHNSMQITSKGNVLGSVHYLAPELAKGNQATMQSDIYSLGIVFYELLTGDVPYKADTPVQVALAHVRNNVPYVRKFNPDIPQAVENIVIKATARSLKDRYQNVALLIQDLNRCMSPEARNDKRVILHYSNTNIDEVKEEKKIEQQKKKNKEEKKANAISAIFISIVSLISIAAVVLILYFTGIIGNNNDKYVVVPSVEGLSLTVAEDVLNPLGLSIDKSNIKWELTDDIDANMIISISPVSGSKIEKGSKITVTVSEGKYSTMANYVGQNFDTVKKLLVNSKFSIEGKAVESDLASGTIISQSIDAGTKYNPNVVTKLVFTYAQESTLMIPYEIVGKNIDEAISYFENLGFVVEKQEIDYSSLSEEYQKYENNTVFDVSPSAGTLYTKSDDSKIILRYFTNKEVSQ